MCSVNRHQPEDGENVWSQTITQSAMDTVHLPPLQYILYIPARSHSAGWSFHCSNAVIVVSILIFVFALIGGLQDTTPNRLRMPLLRAHPASGHMCHVVKWHRRYLRRWFKNYYRSHHFWALVTRVELRRHLLQPKDTAAAGPECLLRGRWSCVKQHCASASHCTIPPLASSATDMMCHTTGGIVRVPSGTFLTAPFNLTSNIVLAIDSGGKILGTTNISLVPRCVYHVVVSVVHIGMTAVKLVSMRVEIGRVTKEPVVLFGYSQ